MNLFEHIDKLNDSMVNYLNKILLKFVFFFCTDETVTEWILDEATNLRQRTLKYKVPYEAAFIGKNTILTRERQVSILFI